MALELKSKFVKLNIQIINTDGYVIRSIDTDCILNKKHVMPTIQIRDQFIHDVFTNSDLAEDSIPFFDMTRFQFMFAASDILSLRQNDECYPQCIYITLMQLDLQDPLESNYVTMNPGIFKNIESGFTRRIADDPKYFINALSVLKHKCNDESSFITEFFERYKKFEENIGKIKVKQVDPPIKSKTTSPKSTPKFDIEELFEKNTDTITSPEDADNTHDDGTITKISIMIPLIGKDPKDIIKKLMSNNDINCDYPKILNLGKDSGISKEDFNKFIDYLESKFQGHTYEFDDDIDDE